MNISYKTIYEYNILMIFLKENSNFRAISDSKILINIVYFILKKYFSMESYYINIIEIIHNVSFQIIST